MTGNRTKQAADMPRILLVLILAVYSEVSHGVCVNKQTNVVTFADVGKSVAKD